jgi:orotate phosphoribosyltransferase
VGRSVVVVEDLVSTGQSSLNAVQALREAGCEVKGMVSIFTYGFDEARKAFEQARVKLVSLTDYPILLDQALHSNYITEKDLLSLNEWRRDPANWNQTTTPA